MKFVTYVPKHYNDRTPVKPAVVTRLIDELRGTFRGLTIEGSAEGYWTDDAGVQYHDMSLKVAVVCDNSRLCEAIRIVRRIGRKLRQKAMYFEVSGYDGVQFLEIQES
jgi:hypothetical protein